MNPRFDWLKVWISFNILFFFFFQVVSSGQIQDVPLAPNESMVTTKVLEYSILNSTLASFFGVFTEARNMTKAL